MRPALLFAIVAGCAAARPTLAVTIDDLPWAGGVGPGDSEDAAAGRILSALAKHAVPATAFVICDRLAPGGGAVSRWHRAGIDLGNHSSSHRAVDRMSIDEWERDVSACQARLRALTGRAARWFRYPYLEMGRTVAQRDASLRVLRRHALLPAPVSVDPDDWRLDRDYVAALAAGDRAGARRIGVELIDRILRAVRARPPRKGPVLLLHANALTADYLDALLAALERKGVRFVSLSEALR